MRSACLAKQPLDDDAIAPFVAEYAVSPIHPHFTKSHARHQGAARHVLRKNARHQLPKSRLGRRVNKRRDSNAARASATVVSRDIDRIFRDTSVTFAIPIT